MPRIDVRGNTRDVISPSKGNLIWGRWTVNIEGGFDEEPDESFAEALRRVKGLIAATTNAKEITMYGGEGNIMDE